MEGNEEREGNVTSVGLVWGLDAYLCGPGGEF